MNGRERHRNAPDGDCPFGFDDAAYLFGALSAGEHRAYEDHLADCRSCAARLDTLRPVLALLDRAGQDEPIISVGEVDRAETGGPPPTLLPEVIAAVERRRRGQRWLVRGLAGAAAAAVIALAVVLGASVASSGGSGGSGVAMTALNGSPVRAVATLTSQPWGTEISLDCRYLPVASYPNGGGGQLTYTLRVTGRDGALLDLGSWTLRPGHDLTFTSGTAMARDQIRNLQVLLPDGTPVLRLAE